MSSGQVTADQRWTGLTVALVLTVAIASFESTATLSLPREMPERAM